MVQFDAAEIIDSILNAFELHYVYPDTARNLSKHIRSRFADGAYDDAADLAAFAGKLSDDMRAFTHDKHVRISVMSPDNSQTAADTLTDEKIAWRARSNFGFRKAE